MPTESPYPRIQIPEVGLWDFLFERKDKPYPDDHIVFQDAYTKRSYTYAQTRSTAIDFGKGLKGAWDWQKGDVIAMFTPNSIDTPIVMWGAHWAGATVSPANPGYSVDELAFQLKDSGAKALVTQWPVIATARAAAKKVGLPEDRIILIGDQRDPEMKVKHFTSIRNTSGTNRFRRTKVDPEKDLAFLVYSSGTTGLPKGVMLCHRNIVANTLQVGTAEGPLSPKDRILAFLPFFHIYGLTVILHMSFHKGCRTVVMPKFDIEDFCRITQEEKITFSYVAPPVVLLLSKHPVVEKYDLSTIRMMNSGAAPLTKELVNAVYERTKLKVKQGYGLSETSPTTHTQQWDVWHSTVGSVGILLPNMTAKYMSPEETEVPVGEVGELWLKGPNIFKGYLNNAEGTANALTSDGYFKTGDVGYQDKDNNFFITDRVKELIKYKGFQVPPAELEGYLVAHEKIDDVAVIGIYREDLATEVPRAYVVPRKGVEAGKALEDDIVSWIGAKVANHKKLRGGVRFVDQIPKSISGKILRRVLKVQAEEEAKKGQKAKL
ncbi:acetyl-CoA synthetase-like protein [Aureobasidium pullulans]|uniref:Acetyl-CoA synthetase-like protein n=1 Tax=Aureobasidium pullulans TaxID=5580 RepID=A0A4S9YQK8_AURPU|nr:acetyl-CoA synthetase-like protein [Aureobasidium pullulans]THZ93814.1 acetyl-CoA synthetase-like protein [Aureobasidium pullulans]